MTSYLRTRKDRTPIVRQQPVLDLAFRWRDRHGVFYSMSNMDSGHLYNTVKMIWNNTVPAFYLIGNVKLYKFNAFYTKDYMHKAIVQAVMILSERKDLTAEQIAGIQEMYDHINRNDFGLLDANPPKLEHIA